MWYAIEFKSIYFNMNLLIIKKQNPSLNMCGSCRKSIIVRHNVHIFFGGEDDCSIAVQDMITNARYLHMQQLVRN